MGYYAYITALEPRAEAKLRLATLAGREPGQLYWVPVATEVWDQTSPWPCFL